MDKKQQKQLSPTLSSMPARDTPQPDYWQSQQNIMAVKKSNKLGVVGTLYAAVFTIGIIYSFFELMYISRYWHHLEFQVLSTRYLFMLTGAIGIFIVFSIRTVVLIIQRKKTALRAALICAWIYLFIEIPNILTSFAQWIEDENRSCTDLSGSTVGMPVPATPLTRIAAHAITSILIFVIVFFFTKQSEKLRSIFTK